VVELHLAVQAHRSGLDALSDSVCTAQVTRPGGGGQPVGAVIGQSDRFVLVVERNDGYYWSEDLLLEDEVALAVKPMPASDDSDAVGLAVVEVAQDTGELLLADQRADQAALVIRAALWQSVRNARQLPHELLVDTVLDEDP
jgi:hypothetical protein